ncbi:MAG: diguanylate cyclase [Anaerosomatales bacterium]|nr:diguanylate cyclase [Anaerosomatales bacterium]
MTDDPATVGTQGRSRVPGRVYYGLPTLVGVFVAIGYVAPGSMLAESVRHAIYVVTPLLASALLVLTAVRTAARERRLWAGLALGIGLFSASGLVVAAEVVTLGVPAWPLLSVVLILVGSLTSAATLVLTAGFRTASPFVEWRHLFDLLAGSLVLFTVVLRWVVYPMSEAYGGAGTAMLVVMSVYSVLGALLVVGALVNYAGTRLRARSAWERLLVWGLGCVGVALALFPAWYLGAVLDPASPLDRGVQTLTLAGLYLIAEAGHARLAAGRTGRPVHGLPRMRPMRHTVVASAAPAVFVLAIPACFAAARSGATPSLEGVWWFSGIAASVIVVGRTVLTALENGTLFKRAVTDPVTGLLGHRYFHERLAMEVELAERHEDQLSVAILDIDDFSRVNDAGGHAGGDEVLRVVARGLEGCIRASDTVCRLGGDEFGIILPGASADEAMVVCQRAHERVARVIGPDGRTLTATTGVAGYPRDGETADALIHKADGAQYWAKYHGKDRVLLFDEDVVDALSAEDRLRALESQSHLSTVRALAAAVDARDPLTQYHSRNVAVLTVMLARELGLDVDKTRLLEVAALLHDIGKIGVADAVLRKRGALTATERRHVREHPALGERILASTHLHEILPWVRHHHERWDGNGYPDGLTAGEIPYEARLMAVCDAYDAMTSDRPYRSALSSSAALQELDLCIGTQFDPAVAETFIRMISARPLLRPEGGRGFERESGSTLLGGGGLAGGVDPGRRN